MNKIGKKMQKKHKKRMERLKQIDREERKLSAEKKSAGKSKAK